MISIRVVLDLIALIIMVFAAFPQLSNRFNTVNLIALSFVFWMLARLVV